MGSHSNAGGIMQNISTKPTNKNNKMRVVPVVIELLGTFLMKRLDKLETKE